MKPLFGKSATDTVVKASGELEAFKREKLYTSVLKTGVPPPTAELVLTKIRSRIHSGIATSAIHREVHALLLEEGRRYADRYQLKRAIMDLGPSGFPFEKYIASILRSTGYLCTVNQIVPGKCVDHEVDVIVSNPNESAWIECKFHNLPGTKTDLKVSLYCYARFLDLRSGPQSDLNRLFWIITNTKFTTQAIQYAKCMGMRLTGWNFPPERPLQALIEGSEMYPITCLSALKSGHKQKLLRLGISSTSEVRDSPNILRKIGLTHLQAAGVLDEIRTLCRSYK